MVIPCSQLPTCCFKHYWNSLLLHSPIKTRCCWLRAGRALMLLMMFPWEPEGHYGHGYCTAKAPPPLQDLNGTSLCCINTLLSLNWQCLQWRLLRKTCIRMLLFTFIYCSSIINPKRAGGGRNPPPPSTFRAIISQKFFPAPRAFMTFFFQVLRNFWRYFRKNWAYGSKVTQHYVLERRLKIWKFSGFVYKTYGKWLLVQKLHFEL